MSDVRHLDGEGKRIVWVTRKGSHFHLEDLHDNHLLKIYENQIRYRPENPVLDYLWSEIEFRGLEV